MSSSKEHEVFGFVQFYNLTLGRIVKSVTPVVRT